MRGWCLLFAGVHQLSVRCCRNFAELCHRAGRQPLITVLPPLRLPPPQFTGCLKDDVTTRRWLAQLLVNVGHLQDAAALGTDVVGPTPPV